MAESRGDTPFEGAGDGYRACAGVRGRRGAAELVRSAILAGRPEDVAELCTGSVSVHALHELTPLGCAALFLVCVQIHFIKVPAFTGRKRPFRERGQKAIYRSI